MLRINLLPPYIHDASKRRNVIALWVVALLVVIGGMIAFKSSIDKQTDKIKSDQAAIEGTAKKADDDQALANNINTQSQTVRDKYTFVKNAREHDEHVYPDTFEDVAKYTWSRVLYDSISPQGDTITMSAYTPSLADVGQYIMAMERDPNISRVDIRMGDIPGYGPGYDAVNGVPPGGGAPDRARPYQGGGHDFEVALHLYKPIPTGPSYPAGGGGGAAGGAGPGMMMPGGSMGGMGGMGGMGPGGPPGMSSGGMGSMGGMMPGGGGPAGGGPRGGKGGAAQ